MRRGVGVPGGDRGGAVGGEHHRLVAAGGEVGERVGLAVGRGALISVILVLSVLPQLIVLLDKVIETTTFRKKTTTGGAVE